MKAVLPTYKLEHKSIYDRQNQEQLQGQKKVIIC
jgi:hypothetical protein